MDPARRTRIASALGTLELALPEGERLVADAGVADGEMLVWAPAPELGGFSVSHGPAAGRRAEDLLALERGFADAVEVDEQTGGERELCLRVETHEGRDLVEDEAGIRSALPERVRRERLRFRFWEEGDAALRVGYRLDESAPGELRAAFDRLTDSARLERGR
jgi:hypothetical protein